MNLKKKHEKKKNSKRTKIKFSVNTVETSKTAKTTTNGMGLYY